MVYIRPLKTRKRRNEGSDSMSGLGGEGRDSVCVLQKDQWITFYVNTVDAFRATPQPPSTHTFRSLEYTLQTRQVSVHPLEGIRPSHRPVSTRRGVAIRKVLERLRPVPHMLR